MKNILMIINEEFPPGERAEKEAVSLINEGYNLFVLCINFAKRPQTEVYKGIKIYRINFNKYFRNKLYALYLILPFYKWIWQHYIEKVIKSENIDILHVHDLPLTDVGIKLKEKYNLKIVSDQHEYYSNWIVHTAHYNTFIGKIVKKISNWQEYEQKHLKKTDLVLTVEEPLRKLYINEVGIQKEKIICVKNTASKKVFDQNNIDFEIADKYKKHFIVFYVGGMTVLKGVDIAVRSLPYIVDEIPEIKLVLVGKMAKNSNPIKLAEDLKVINYVDFIGWVDHTKIPSYINASDICFHIPPAINKEVNSTIQTKIYKYIAMNKPIIVGESKFLKEYIENNNIGISIKDQDHLDFAKKVIYLYQNKNLIKEFSNNCQNLHNQIFWEDTVKDLISYYKNKLYV